MAFLSIEHLIDGIDLLIQSGGLALSFLLFDQYASLILGFFSFPIPQKELLPTPNHNPEGCTDRHSELMNAAKGTGGSYHRGGKVEDVVQIKIHLLKSCIKFGYLQARPIGMQFANLDIVKLTASLLYFLPSEIEFEFDYVFGFYRVDAK